jgi:N-methylhydantoinase B
LPTGVPAIFGHSHSNVLYKVDVKLSKRGDKMTPTTAAEQAGTGLHQRDPPGLMGGACGNVLTTLGWDIQWNQGILKTAEVIAPDGLILTAQFPAPVGSATVETIRWFNATMLALNKLP